MGSRFVIPTVAACVDLVVHLALGPDGSRRVEEILAVPGRVESDIIETEPVFTRLGGELERMGGQPPHPGRFTRLGIDLTTVLQPPDDARRV
jgi:pilus assembly protein CpaF